MTIRISYMYNTKGKKVPVCFRNILESKRYGEQSQEVESDMFVGIIDKEGFFLFFAPASPMHRNQTTDKCVMCINLQLDNFSSLGDTFRNILLLDSLDNNSHSTKCVNIENTRTETQT